MYKIDVDRLLRWIDTKMETWFNSSSSIICVGAGDDRKSINLAFWLFNLRTNLTKSLELVENR